MPGFSPFAGLRYNAEGGFVDDVIAPPYDVIDPVGPRRPRGSERTATPSASSSPTRRTDPDRYEVAAELWRSWQDDRVLVADDEPSFYAYRMGFKDENGRPRQTTGILGALHLRPRAVASSPTSGPRPRTRPIASISSGRCGPTSPPSGR